MRRWLTSNGLKRIVIKPQSWLILAVLVLLTVPHYEEAIRQPEFLTNVLTNLGLTRHAFERILYLAPIVWAGFLFGWRGAVLTSTVALGCMLPRAIFISPSPLDAILETSAVFILGNVLAIAFESLRRERQRRTELEVTQHELAASEQRYRALFENAHDAIWVQDMDGSILAANEAAARLTGYAVDDLTSMNVKDFLSQEGLDLARIIRHQLFQGETLQGAYDQSIIRKDKTEALLRLSSNLLRQDGEPVVIQHIARDVTEEKHKEEKLIEARQIAQKASYAKTTFLAIMSHEIRTPLTLILGPLEQLISEVAKEKWKKQLQIMWQMRCRVPNGRQQLAGR